ncbi:hypothetical protein EOD41_10865 [Mucilaginibacter limnophilus]|uniref:Uncharacterized protein n=1 Tax=Mucilaginibacter limnophilus TaxID=1932778 RepID=A0A437MTY2_9SPHI|nr:hypothetical protein [Mucilaginibacter limnophilus]RVU01107.1 hypothetical protein EOD41_10865 [Mucilaginibacter limnophilus]
MKKLKKTTHKPVPVPHNAPLWQDWYGLFKEFFTENPDNLVTYVPDAKSLVCNLEARFKGNYDVYEIQKKLDACYKKVKDKGYEFLRSDFIKEVEP